MAESFSALVNRVGTMRNLLNEHQAQMFFDANFNKDGSLSKAPHFSKRGHNKETDAVYTLAENYLANLGDMEKIHIASDRVAYNGPTLPVNDQYRDIIVEDLTNGITRAYQSKVCKDAESSIAAATNPKYINAGVIPLVPSDHAPEFSTIGSIKVNGKTITSDPRTLKETDDLTRLYENGYLIHNFGEDKMNRLYNNALKDGATNGAKSAFVNRGISEVIKYLTCTNDKPQDAIKVSSHMIAATIDGAIRGALINDAAFKDNPYAAKNIATTSYSLAKDCFNYVVKRRNNESFTDALFTSMNRKASGFLSSIFGKVGANMGAKFGPVGMKIGQFLGSGIGRSITQLVSGVPIGNKALTTLGTSLTINGLLGGASNEIMNMATRGIASLGRGVKALASSMVGFVAAHPILSVGIGILAALLLGDDGMSAFSDIRSERDRALNEINSLYEEYKSHLTYKVQSSFKALSSLFFDISVNREISAFQEEANNHVNTASREKDNIEAMQKALNNRKALYEKLAEQLPDGNILAFVNESADWGGRRFYSTKQIMEMAQ